ncbi:MAG TPA: Holliday junction resolvase RuvX [Longimicrobiales bacterium]|nr:Holliday junction resolvase RuvX [Longimicrobiales bacterium]
MARVLGVDYGEKRIGLAVSDPIGMIAQPLPTITRRRGKRPPYAEIERIARELEAVAIVVGLPLTSEGDESDWTRAVRAFGDRLAERTALPVYYVDERMTSARAERTIRASGLSRARRQQKDRVDAGAAMFILQAHLDAIARGNADDS